MRKLIFQEFISLDGYAADKNHSTSFFESPVYSAKSDNDLLKEMHRFDNILLGAKTYKLFADFWPTANNDEQIVADKLNSIPKIVFSNTLTSAPWGKWSEASIMNGDAADNVKELKKRQGTDMVLWGSISIAQRLMEENLIDEYQIRIVPVILGSGILLFKPGSELQLELISSKNYPSGLQLIHYRPK